MIPPHTKIHALEPFTQEAVLMLLAEHFDLRKLAPVARVAYLRAINDHAYSVERSIAVAHIESAKGSLEEVAENMDDGRLRDDKVTAHNEQWKTGVDLFERAKATWVKADADLRRQGEDGFKSYSIRVSAVVKQAEDASNPFGAGAHAEAPNGAPVHRYANVDINVRKNHSHMTIMEAGPGSNHSNVVGAINYGRDLQAVVHDFAWVCMRHGATEMRGDIYYEDSIKEALAKLAEHPDVKAAGVKVPIYVVIGKAMV